MTPPEGWDGLRVEITISSSHDRVNQQREQRIVDASIRMDCRSYLVERHLMDAAGVEWRHDGRRAVEWLMEHSAHNSEVSDVLLDVVRRIEHARSRGAQRITVDSLRSHGRHRSVAWARVLALILMFMGATVRMIMVQRGRSYRDRDRLCGCEICNRRVRGTELRHGPFYQLVEAVEARVRDRLREECGPHDGELLMSIHECFDHVAFEDAFD